MPLLASCDTRSAFEMTFEGRKLPVPTIRANDMINTDQNVEGGPPSSGKNPRAGDCRISSAIGGERQFRPRLTPPPAYHKCLSRRSRHSRISVPIQVSPFLHALCSTVDEPDGSRQILMRMRLKHFTVCWVDQHNGADET